MVDKNKLFPGHTWVKCAHSSGSPTMWWFLPIYQSYLYHQPIQESIRSNSTAFILKRKEKPSHTRAPYVEAA